MVAIDDLYDEAKRTGKTVTQLLKEGYGTPGGHARKTADVRKQRGQKKSRDGAKGIPRKK